MRNIVPPESSSGRPYEADIEVDRERPPLCRNCLTGLGVVGTASVLIERPTLGVVSFSSSLVRVDHQSVPEEGSGAGAAAGFVSSVVSFSKLSFSESHHDVPAEIY